MRNYELMYILDPSAEESELEVRQRVESLITGRDGVVITYERLGKKRLAYPIAKRNYGIYYLVNFKGDPRIVAPLENYLRFNTDVLRHMIILFTPKELALKEKTERVLAEEALRMKMGGKPLTLIKEELGEELDVILGEGIDETLEEEEGDELRGEGGGDDYLYQDPFSGTDEEEPERSA